MDVGRLAGFGGPGSSITLTQEEHEMLEAVTRCGKTNAPKFIHARALLPCDAGPYGSGEPWKVADVAEALWMTSRTIEHLKERFVEQGLNAALESKSRTTPRKVNFGVEFEARLTAFWPALRYRTDELVGRSACLPTKPSNSRSPPPFPP